MTPGELAIGWPLRGLEFVLYTTDAVAVPAWEPRFLQAGRRRLGPRPQRRGGDGGRGAGHPPR